MRDVVGPYPLILSPQGLADFDAFTLGEDVTISANDFFLMSGATWAISGGASFSGHFAQSGTVLVGSLLTLSGNGWQMDTGSATTLGAGANIIYNATQPAIIDGLLDFGMGGDTSVRCGPLCPSPGFDLKTGGIMRVWAGGCTFVGSLENGAGTLQFMNTSASLDIVGDYVQFLGTLEARVSGTGTSSHLNVSGNVTLNQTLRVIADSPIQDGASFTVLSAGGEKSGDFTTFDLPDPPPGNSWTHSWVPGIPPFSTWDYRLALV